MTLLKLSHDLSHQIDLHCTSWHEGDCAVFFRIQTSDGQDRGGASFTPDEARQFAAMLIEKADHIETMPSVIQRKTRESEQSAKKAKNANG